MIAACHDHSRYSCCSALPQRLRLHLACVLLHLHLHSKLKKKIKFVLFCKLNVHSATACHTNKKSKSIAQTQQSKKQNEESPSTHATDRDDTTSIHEPMHNHKSKFIFNFSVFGTKRTFCVELGIPTDRQLCGKKNAK